MITTVEELKEIIGKTKKEQQVVGRLDAAGIRYIDQRAAGDTDTFDLKIPLNGGDGSFLRVYIGVVDKDIHVQKWTKTTVRYSGIPVFMPSGRNSL